MTVPNETTSDRGSSPREVVKRFYCCVREGDIGGLLALVDEEFSPDVVLHEPESLPYGGLHEGRDRVKQLLSGLASPRSPIVASKLQVDEILVASTPGSVEAFVALSYPWLPFADESRCVSALERWTFRDQKVTSVAAFLWDTAACVAALRQAS